MTDRADVEILAALEDVAFAAALNVVSSTTAFVAALRRTPEFARAVEFFRNRPANLAAMIERTKSLALDQAIDLEYESPFDCALAAHVLIAAEISESSLAAVATLASRAPAIWWARRVSEDALGNRAYVARGPQTSVTPTSVVAFSQAPARAYQARSTSSNRLVAMATALLAGTYGVCTVRRHDPKNPHTAQVQDVQSAWGSPHNFLGATSTGSATQVEGGAA